MLPGFTLLEVLLVLALLAAAAAIIAPALHSMTARQPLDQAGRVVIATIQELRTSAVQEQQRWQLTTNAQGSMLRADSDRGAVRELLLPTGIRLLADSSTLLGECTRDGRIVGTELRLADEQGHGMSIAFHPLTGAVSRRRTTEGAR